MGTATLVKSDLPKYAGTAHLYRLDPPIEATGWEWGHDVKTTYEYVVVSGVHVTYTGSETYIFPADKEGNVTNWGELDGSFRGEVDHERALEQAGYTVID